MFDGLLGHGIFNADGPQWKLQRKAASHLFNVRMLRETMFPIFVDHSNEMKDHLLAASAEGKVVEMQVCKRYKQHVPFITIPFLN